MTSFHFVGLQRALVVRCRLPEHREGEGAGAGASPAETGGKSTTADQLGEPLCTDLFCRAALEVSRINTFFIVIRSCSLFMKIAVDFRRYCDCVSRPFYKQSFTVQFYAIVKFVYVSTVHTHTAERERNRIWLFPAQADGCTESAVARKPQI